jgi:predicted helicase
VRGLRSSKYEYLQNNSIASVSWNKINPTSPYYFFVPTTNNLRPEYEKYWSITDVMPVNSSCMNTARDALVIDVNREELVSRIKTIREPTKDTNQLAGIFGLQNTGWWNFQAARTDLQKTENWQDKIIHSLYRPFDERWLFHHPSFIDRPRTEINSHLIHENLSLVTTRQTKEPFAALATNLICSQHKIVAVYDRSFFFPLYLYTTPEETAGTLFAQLETTRRPNLAPAFIAAFSEKLGLQFIQDGIGDLKKTFGPEDVFYYAYAVFHSPTYRTRYAEFLKIDFPRLPLTSDKKLFAKLVAKGKELVELHLLKSSKKDDFITTFPEAGDNKVEKVAYASGKVHINAHQYFGKLPEEVWEFKVGGYQVCEKWLKDRKGRVLSSEDITHYQRVVVSLRETIRLMKEIDKAIVQWPME